MAPFRQFFPWIALALGVGLGLRFQRLHIVYLLVVVACIGTMLHKLPVNAPPPLGTVRLLLMWLLPVNLLLVAVMVPRLLSHSSRYILLLLVLQAGVVSILSWGPGLLVQRWLTRPLPLPWLSGYGLPESLLLFFIFALILLSGYFIHKPAAGSGCLLFIGISLLLGIIRSDRLVWYFATANLILVASLVETTFRLAFHDALTGLPGRRALDEALAPLTGTYTIAMVDIDHFKRFNDRYGHDTGDEVLKKVAKTLQNVRLHGKAFRYGGEEFCLLFNGKELSAVLPELERLRKAIASAPFVLRNRRKRKRSNASLRGRKTSIKRSKRIYTRVSMGAAQAGSRQQPKQVVKAADKALYRAKRGGRNRVCYRKQP